MSTDPENAKQWLEDTQGWEHVSVSCSTRCPWWEQMQFVKELIRGDREVVADFFRWPANRTRPGSPDLRAIWVNGLHSSEMGERMGRARSVACHSPRLASTPSAARNRLSALENTMPTVPINVEDWGRLRDRFPLALKKLWRSNDAAQGTANDRPGVRPAHVFDCPNGMRFIVDRESLPDGGFVHISASSFGGDKLEPEEFLRRAQEAFMELTEETLPEPSSIDEAGIPHWMMPEIPSPLN